jgi:hypothetical protein
VRADYEMVGASPFPCHWIYDHSGRHVAKSGLLGFGIREAFGSQTPCGRHRHACSHSTRGLRCRAKDLRPRNGPQSTFERLEARQVLVR